MSVGRENNLLSLRVLGILSSLFLNFGLFHPAACLSLEFHLYKGSGNIRA